MIERKFYTQGRGHLNEFYYKPKFLTHVIRVFFFLFFSLFNKSQINDGRCYGQILT